MKLDQIGKSGSVLSGRRHFQNFTRTYCLNVKSSEERVVYKKAELNGDVDSEDNHGGSSMDSMYYIGLDVHKKTISYCIKNASGQVHREGTIGSTRNELDSWMKTLPQPWQCGDGGDDLHGVDL